MQVFEDHVRGHVRHQDGLDPPGVDGPREVALDRLAVVVGQSPPGLEAGHAVFVDQQEGGPRHVEGHADGVQRLVVDFFE